MTIDEQRFYRRLSIEFAGGENVGRRSRLDLDLGIDSLAMLELRAALEDVAGRDVADDLWNEISTAGELYDWFSIFAEQREPTRSIEDPAT